MTQRQRPWGLFTRRIWGQRRDVKTLFLYLALFFPNHWNCNNPPNDRRGEADQEFDASSLLRPSKPLPNWLHRPGRLSMLSLLSFFYGYWRTLCVRLILQWQNVRRVQSYSQDGCIEDFENNSEFSQKYQVSRFVQNSEGRVGVGGTLYCKVHLRLPKTACVTRNTCLRAPRQNSRYFKRQNSRLCWEHKVPFADYLRSPISQINDVSDHWYLISLISQIAIKQDHRYLRLMIFQIILISYHWCLRSQKSKITDIQGGRSCASEKFGLERKC